MILQQAGIQECDFLTDAKECMEAFRMHPYRIILVEYPTEMGEHARLVRRLRDTSQQDKNAQSDIEGLHIAAILPTGTKPLIKAAILAGASAIWIKPLSPAGVQKRMGMMLNMLNAQHCRDSLLKKLDDI